MAYVQLVKFSQYKSYVTPMLLVRNSSNRFTDKNMDLMLVPPLSAVCLQHIVSCHPCVTWSVQCCEEGGHHWYLCCVLRQQVDRQDQDWYSDCPDWYIPIH